MKDIYKIKTSGAAPAESTVTGAHYRITVLTERLLRLEYSADDVFEDRPTQTVLNRDFDPVNYDLKRTGEGIELTTGYLHLTYDEKAFSAHGLCIEVGGLVSFLSKPWHYGDVPKDLGGTARTLDRADGAIPLEQGIASIFGWSLLDDAKSQVLLPDGWIEPRKRGIQDLYFFGYGHDYRAALQDFYRLCGKTPMLPRYALGNWWSRYYKYTEQSYMELMERFGQEKLPFTVAVIDMDWHLTEIDPKYGTGWTGYTWNRDYFPDPERFLRRLHERGMHTTLNLHPAEGVGAHEDAYKAMAEALGNIDTEQEETIPCDMADPRYLEAYFEYLHYPLERQGVDFWWIDWQQGTHTKVEGLDPLWILNHYHYLDSEKNGKRGMMFSRYAGPGSHRYPVGFSGDTVITWESLDFQPYFTATASNIGYGWWSHDIGGHMLGYKDDELEARWYEFGVYSPIMRLHSTSSEFNGKEPWRFKKESELAMDAVLRERHRMIPYLYTMNYRAYQENLPLIQPLYYAYPEEREAYQRKNQYFFGTELMAAPITSPRVPKLNAARVTAWLPEGVWYDIYTGLRYEGGRMMNLYRDLMSIPVLAKAGAILPFTDEISGVQAGRNPESLHIYVYAGANGDFTLYEDDNETCAYRDGVCVTTGLTYRETGETGNTGRESWDNGKAGIAGKAVFIIHPAQGEYALIPEARSYMVELTGFAESAAESVEVTVGGRRLDARAVAVGVKRLDAQTTTCDEKRLDTRTTKEEARTDGGAAKISYNKKKQALVIRLPRIPVREKIVISADLTGKSTANDVTGRCYDFLNQAEISFLQKDMLYRLITSGKRTEVLLSQLCAMELDPDLYGALVEILTACP